MTIVTPHPEQAPIDEAELLFKEARQRRRRRWLVSGVVMVVLTAALIVALVARPTEPVVPSSSSKVPTPPTRPVTSATGAAQIAWVDNYGQLHIGDISGYTQRVVAQADADPTAPLVTAGGRIFWVRSQVPNPNQPLTPIANQEVFGFDAATGRTVQITAGTQVMASVDHTFIYVETDSRHLSEYSLDGVPLHRTLHLPTGWYLLSPGLNSDPTPVVANGILVVSAAFPHTATPIDGTLAIWDPATGHIQSLGPAWEVSATYTAPGARSSLIAWYPASCGTSEGCKLEITNTATYSSRFVASPPNGSFLWGGGFSPDGRQLAVFAASADIGGDPTAQLAIVDTQSGSLKLVSGVHVYVGDSVHWALWLPDGSHLVTGGLGGPFGSNAPAVDVLVDSRTRRVSPFRFIADSNQDLTISTVLLQ